MPGEFISIFERNGFIYEMDKYIWEKTCALLNKWLGQGQSPQPVSVNISRYDVFRDDLVEVLLGLVRKYEIPIELLRLEITESAFSKSTKQIVSIVKQLISCGFVVEIDDFGSGYSSLNTLKDVPAQIVKLDMRFLGNTGDSDRSGYIIESVVRMVKWLDMTLIAEGVETESQANYLKSIGCNYVQGYLYAKPIPIEEYEALTKNAIKERNLITVETVDNLDNNSFWNPNSIDSLIFNSYAGSACIFEYHDNKIEMLRSTDKHTQMMEDIGLPSNKILKFDWFGHLDEKSKVAASKAIGESRETRRDVAGEYVFLNLSDTCKKVYFRSTLRVIATAGNRSLVYCTNENITELRNTEQQAVATADQLRFLNDTAHDLLTQNHTDTGIHAALRKILEYFRADSIYIVELDKQSQSLNKTYTVSVSETSSDRSETETLPYDAFPLWLSAFEDGRYINIADVSSMDDDRSEERQILSSLSIKSVLAGPLYYEDRLAGLVVINEPSFYQGSIEWLQPLGDYLIAMLNRRDLIAKIESSNRALQELMNDTPGGFVRMRVLPNGNIATEYANRPFCRMRGMSFEEITTNDVTDPMSLVHPDDADLVLHTIAEMIDTGEPRSIKYRLKHSDGTYMLLDVFGRTTKNENGEIFINAYYTELSEEKKSEYRKNELVMQLVAEHSDRLVYRYDLASKSCYADVNQDSQQLTFITSADVDDTVIDCGDIMLESVKDYQRFFNDIHDGKRAGNAKIHTRDSHGKPRWIDMKYTLIYDDNNVPEEAVLSVLDITENHERELAYSRYLQSITHSSANNSVLIYLEADVTLDITEKQGGRMLTTSFPAVGSSRTDIVEHIARSYVITEEREKYRLFFSRDHLITAFSDGARELTNEWHFTFPNEQSGYTRSELQMVQDPYSGNIKVYTILRDITDEKLKELAVKKQVEIDGMTGLYNKTTAESMISKQLSSSTMDSCALLLADLDNLKEINDTFGHNHGDQAIKLIADRLRSQFRKTDILGRIGGDEFVVLLENITEARLRSILMAFMHKLSSIRIDEKIEYPLHGSVGIALGTSGDTYNSLFEKADKALYHVKRNGKDDFAFYTPKMEDHSFKYEGSGIESKWQSSYCSAEEPNHLLNAVSSLYSTVISINLTQNSYHILRCSNRIITERVFLAGLFDDLISTASATFHPDDRQAFLSAFSRESLLTAYEQGEAKVSQIGSQLWDHNSYRVLHTDIIFVNDDSDDVLAIVLAKEIKSTTKRGA
ncbi:MAG: EAL domain-containing protein [Clostridiales bacterium]|nr:EAL domain-containing protein [Clostridiales bacterium]